MQGLKKRKVVIGLVLLAAMAIVSTYAWNVDSSLTTDPTKVYVTSNPGTSTTITNYLSKPMGKNQIKITFTVASGPAVVNFMFLDTNGDTIACNRAVTFDSNATVMTRSSDNMYYIGTTQFTTGAHTIYINRAGGQVDTTLYQDLDTVTAGSQTFNGLMIVIR